jgi:hypothetical protein
MARLAAFLLLLFAATGGAAAQTWQAAGEPFRRYGVLTAACLDDGGVCLAVACPEGQLQLVSAAGGGGPMNERTTIITADRRFEVTFTWDDRGIDILGIAASRAPIDRSMLDAMAASPRIVLRSNGLGSPITHRFATRNLAREVQRIAASCRAR